MKNDVVEAVKSCLTSGLVAQMSAAVDETEPNVRKALNKSVPLVLKGLLNRLEQGYAPDALQGLARAAHAAQALKYLASPQGASWNEHSTQLLPDMLGRGYRTTVQEVAEALGIRPMASGTLLQLVANAVLGVLGQVTTEKSFTPPELTDWVLGQKDVIGAALLQDALDSAMLPPGARLAPASGMPAAARLAVPVARHTPTPWPHAAAEPAHAPEGPSWLRWQWGALLLVAVCLGYLFGRGQFGDGPAATSTAMEAALGPQLEETRAPTTAAAETTPPASTRPTPRPATLPTRPTARPVSSLAARRPPATPAAGHYDAGLDRYVFDMGAPVTLELPNGSAMRVGTKSTECRLYTFLATDEEVDSVNRTKGWINFDRVNFDLNQATLTPESAEQLGNIASILNSFPRTLVKIGGYTDSTGDAELNYRLSDDRARATMLALARRGVSPSRLQAKGYGPRYFIMPNTTASGRAVNRRVSIRVVEK